MNTLFSKKTPITAMHDYAVDTNHAYCLTPEQFSRNGLLGLHPIERTFPRENKQFWREVVKANVRQIRQYQLSTVDCHANIEDGVPSASQTAYLSELAAKIETCQQALRIAAEHRLTTFGMVEQTNPSAQSLLDYIAKLRSWELLPENRLYRASVVEDALVEFHNHYWYHDEAKNNFGINNEKYLKELVAIINTMTEYGEMFDMAIRFLRTSERLEHSNSGADICAPLFDMNADFHNAVTNNYKDDDVA